MMIAALTLALAAASPVQDRPAAPPPPGQQPPAGAEPIPLMIAEPVAMAIAAFDTDRDGIVSRAEFDAGVAHSFDTIAKGQSSIGYIQFGDWADRWLGNRNALPSPFEVDRDGDNRITLTELQARFDLFFTRFDRDNDGAIQRSELLTIRAAGRPGEAAPNRRERPRR